MGFFRRLVNGKKRMEGFQGPDPSREPKDRQAIELPSSGAGQSTDNAKPCKVDDISVASYESGDEVPPGQDSKISDDTVSTDPSLAYRGLELTVSDFRILTLSPSSNKNDDIHCTLRRTRFKSIPQDEPLYEALSYTWGDAREKRIIYVNKCPFPVTLSLYTALLYLRRSDVPRVLWIDAICINQEDLAEKTHQVSMMRSIYSSAAGVLLWLGESDKDIRKAMALLQRMDDPAVQWPTDKDLEPFAPGLDKLFKKPWWFRLWVVQEVVVASAYPLLGCGRTWISWRVMKRAMFLLGLRQGGNGGFLQNPAAIQQLAQLPIIGPGHSHNREHWARRLEDLLIATCDRNTTLPHDKIFALLGLTTEDASDEIRVDYEQSYSIAYQKAMVYILNSGSNLDFLVQAMNHRASRDVPSWCIDFSQPNWNSYYNTCGWPDRSQGQTDEGASGKQLKSTILHEARQGTIRISGTVVGRVHHVQVVKCSSTALTSRERMMDLPIVEQRTLQQQIFNLVLQEVIIFSKVARRLLKSRFNEAEVLRALASGVVWKTVAKGRSSIFSKIPNGCEDLIDRDYSALEKFAQEDSAEYRAVAEEWTHLGAAFPSAHQQQATGLDAGRLENLRGWVMSAVFNIACKLRDESFFATDSGYLGRAPTAVNAVRHEDLLYIIHGCDVPVILSPRGRTYKVVTFAHVTDLMDGEYFEGVTRQTRRFTLR